MPNVNNLAVTLVSESGETPVKNSKTKIGSEASFLKLFGKTKDKKQLKTTSEEIAGASLLSQFQFAKNPIVSKELTKTQAVDAKGGKVSVKGNAVEVLGKRIESTESNILDKKQNVASEKTKFPNVVANKTGKSVELHDVKKDLAVNEGLKSEEKIEKTQVKVSKDLNIQNTGRSTSASTSTSTSTSDLSKSGLIAKSNLKFTDSDNKSTEPKTNVGTISSYGLKKISEQVKLEEKVKGVEELKGVEKSFTNEKSLDNDKIVPLTQSFNEMKLDSKDIVKAPLGPNEAQNNFNQIIQQVENGIKINYNNHLKEMKIKLQPEELGEVEIKMTIENNIMKANFVVESQTVKDILESRFDNLRNALNDKGFHGAEINVSVSTGEGNQKNSNNNFVFDRENKIKVQDRTATDYLTKVENLGNNSKIRKTESDSNIDIMI